MPYTKETFSREDALVKIDEFDQENLKIAVLNIFKDSGEVFHLKFHYKTRPKDTRSFVKKLLQGRPFEKFSFVVTTSSEYWLRESIGYTAFAVNLLFIIGLLSGYANPLTAVPVIALNLIWGSLRLHSDTGEIVNNQKK